MLFKVLAVAGWAAVFAISAAQAQSLAGPAETPPASFKGAQYVDSRGCVFLRAGIGGRVTWVPRISRDRRALCGQSPAAAAREVAATPAPVPLPAPSARAPQHSKAIGNKPMETIASLPRAAVPRAVAKPAPVAVAAPIPQPAPPRMGPTVSLHNGCPASSPYGARVTLRDGRRSLLCSSDPGFDVVSATARAQLSGALPPATPRPVPHDQTPPAPAYVPKSGPTDMGVAAGRGYQCPAAAPVARRYAVRGGGSTVMCTTAAGGLESATPPLTLGAEREIEVPKGYRKAWKDDRLNPDRGKGTAYGQAQQDQVWTRDLPAELVAGAKVQKAVKRQSYTTSSSNAPRKAATGRYYVQVGTFGEAANATRTASRLQGLGLPVAKTRITSKGRQLQIVMAGPFGDAGTAKAALSAARRSGFGDAFIR